MSWNTLLRILWYNWRDIKNPDAGGAEVFTHHLILSLSARGHDISLFTSEFPNSLQNENIDGVKVIRSGNKYDVYRTAKDYFKKNKDRYDLFVDSVNTKPFLSPNLVKGKTVLPIIYQLVSEIWYAETTFPVSFFLHHYFEKKWLSRYKETPTVTVSKSSQDDLKSIGFKKIFVVPVGLNIIPLNEVPQKESTPTVAFLGRLKKYKLPHHALEAFSLIKEHVPDAKLWVIGGGSIQKELERRFDAKDITFFGHVNEGHKYELLRKAHLLLVPGVREGWGLVVTESNAMGTPAIAYSVQGLRDSVVDGQTGILIKECSPDGLAHAAITLLKDRALLMKYSHNALEFSRQFSWNRTAAEFDKIINSITKHPS